MAGNHTESKIIFVKRVDGRLFGAYALKCKGCHLFGENGTLQDLLRYYVFLGIRIGQIRNKCC
jgi:hypothetical protein